VANPKKNVANKRRKKQRSWLKKLLFFVSVPLIVWFAAFLIWFYWNGLSELFTGAQKQEAKPAVRGSRQIKPGENSENAPAKPSQEKILDEDRKKLEDILQRRN
jgi:cytoskeletal protein RodZ